MVLLEEKDKQTVLEDNCQDEENPAETNLEVLADR